MFVIDGAMSEYLQLLKAAFQDILTGRTSHLTFADLYKYSYSIVLHKQGEQLYNAIKDVIKDHLENNVRVNLLKSLDNNFLQALTEAWKHHQSAMVIIRDITARLDQTYIEVKKLDNVCDLGSILFKEHIIKYDRIWDHLQTTMVSKAMEERRKGVFDSLAVKNLYHMLVSLLEVDADETGDLKPLVETVKQLSLNESDSAPTNESETSGSALKSSKATGAEVKQVA